MSTFFKYVQVQDFSLAGAGAVAGATSIILKSFTTIDGALLTMTDFGAIGFGTLEPGNGTQEEQISFTGVTQNANGTATLTGVSTVLFVDPYTATSGLAKTHPGSTPFIISNTAGFYNKFGAKANDEVLTGYWEAPDPITPQGLVTNAYMLGLINGGTVSFNRMVEAGIAGETLVAGDLIYFSEVDNEWLKTDADTLATVFNVKLGISQGAGTNGGAITGGVLTRGSYTTSGLTQGDLCYASNTAGAINSGTPGTVPRVIGIAKDSTTLYFDPDFQNELYNYAVDSVGTDAYAVTLSGALSVPFVGMEINFKAGTANTGACTIAINGGSAKSIVKGASTALETNDILANMIVKLVYNGTDFQMMNPRVIDGATQITGIVPSVNLPVPAFQQDVLTSTVQTITGSVLPAFGSNTDGSVFWAVLSDSTEDIVRFERDSVSGQYYETHRVNPTLAFPAGDSGSIILIGTFIYIFTNDGTNIICSRFLAADLTGEQAMTVPTVACTSTATVWTDGVAAYVTSNGSATTSRKWTVSGTTFTAVSTATVANLNNGMTSTMWDGTNAYVVHYDLSDQFAYIYKLTNIDGSSKTLTNTHKYPPLLSDLITGGIGIPIDSTKMYVGLAYANYNELNADTVISSNIALYPVTKP